MQQPGGGGRDGCCFGDCGDNRNNSSSGFILDPGGIGYSSLDVECRFRQAEEQKAASLRLGD